MEWFKDGKRNTKFFYTVVNGRRKMLRISRIQNVEGEWLEQQDEITDEAILFYQNQFQKQPTQTDFDLLEEVPTVIRDEDNEEMQRMSSKKKVYAGAE